MTFSEAMNHVISSSGNAVRRPSMVGYMCRDGNSSPISVKFVRWSSEESGRSDFQYSFELTSDGSFSQVISGPSVSVTAYLMSALMAEDWISTTVTESEQAARGGTDW